MKKSPNVVTLPPILKTFQKITPRQKNLMVNIEAPYRSLTHSNSQKTSFGDHNTTRYSLRAQNQRSAADGSL